jgi:hypothetical protein
MTHSDNWQQLQCKMHTVKLADCVIQFRVPFKSATSHSSYTKEKNGPRLPFMHMGQVGLTVTVHLMTVDTSCVIHMHISHALCLRYSQMVPCRVCLYTGTTSIAPACQTPLCPRSVVGTLPCPQVVSMHSFGDQPAMPHLLFRKETLWLGKTKNWHAPVLYKYITSHPHLISLPQGAHIIRP